MKKFFLIIISTVFSMRLSAQVDTSAHQTSYLISRVPIDGLYYDLSFDYGDLHPLTYGAGVTHQGLVQVRYDVIIPENVTWELMENLNLPDDFPFEIGEEITFDVTYINNRAFSGQHYLSSLYIPDSVKEIGQEALSYCEKLQQISIGSGVTRIDKGLFSKSTNIKIIESYSIIPPSVIDNDLGIWEKLYESIIVYVPKESLDAYSNSLPWCDFKNFAAIEERGLIAENISIDREFSIYPGESYELIAEILPSTASESPVLWSSSDENVAIVSDSGVVTGIRAGTAKITARSGFVADECEVTVKEKRVESIILSKTEAELMMGHDLSLEAILSPVDLGYIFVNWQSSDPKIATVSDTGSVKGVAEGHVTITATVENISAACEIDVVTPYVNTLTISDTELELIQGDRMMSVSLRISPTDAVDKTIIWSVSDEKIVKVENGRDYYDNPYLYITPLRPGEVTITGVCGIASASCHVTVAPAEVDEIWFANRDWILEEGTQCSLTLYKDGWNYVGMDCVEWSVSDPDIVSISDEGVISALSVGTSIITAKYGKAEVSQEIEVVPYYPSSIEIEEKEVEIPHDSSFHLTVQVVPEHSIYRDIEWVSDNEDVVEVRQSGSNSYFMAKQIGEANLTAYCNDVSATCHVVVTPILAESVRINVYTPELKVGESAKWEAQVEPYETDDKTITWESSDNSIATVSGNGLVTAISEGTAIITATCGDVSATCEITVTNPVIEAEQIVLNVEGAELNIGETIQLEATVLPEDTTDKSVSWNTTDSNVATVSENGLVTAISAGKATITGRCGEVFATCLITVINPIIEAESIQLNIEEAKLRINETLQLEATVLPETTTDKTVFWSSSDESVAIVSETGLITALSEGSTIVTATNGKITISCHITVTNTIFAEELKLNTKKVELKKGSRMPLKATIYPENTTDKTIIWNSTNDEVASVSEEGLVTAISAGETVITATCGEASASCEVIVIDDSGVESLLANPDSKISIYSPDGILIKKDCKVEDLKSLAKGIYIIVSGNERYKIYI